MCRHLEEGKRRIEGGVAAWDEAPRRLKWSGWQSWQAVERGGLRGRQGNRSWRLRAGGHDSGGAAL